MARYTLKPQEREITTFKCATCGKRDVPERAYNLTISACSEKCFDTAFEVFMNVNDYKSYGETQMRQLVKDNPIPMY